MVCVLSCSTRHLCLIACMIVAMVPRALFLLIPQDWPVTGLGSSSVVRSLCVQDVKILGEFVAALDNLGPWVVAYAAEHPLFDCAEVRGATDLYMPSRAACLCRAVYACCCPSPIVEYTWISPCRVTE